MKPRPSRSRSLVRRVTGAMLAVAILIAGGWYLSPIVGDVLPGPSRPMEAVIATDDVNLRSGPGTSFDVLTVVPAGSELSAERETVNGFSAVRIDDQQGWIASSYLSAPGVAYAAEYEVGEAETLPVTDAIAAAAEPEPTTVLSQPLPTAVPVMPEPTVEPDPVVVPTAVPVLAETTQVQAQLQPGEKWIEVNRTNRTVTLHNGEIVVATFDALMGKDLSADGYYSTAVGTHFVHVKEKALAETPFADGVYLTDFVGFDPDRSNGFHSPTRDADGNVVITGGTATLGCVRLSEMDAQFLFEFATIGMRVEIHD